MINAPDFDLQRMPLVLHGRPRKRWRYVGVFGTRLMLCAGVVQIGPALQTFWAVWDRERHALRERTRLWRPRPYVRLSGHEVVVEDGTVSVRLRLEPGTPIEAVSDVGGGASIWTRKQGAVRFVGTVTLDGEEIAVDELGCVDESAGYHARRTDWEWSAGVGSLADGRAVGWNLVRGIHDGETGSERYVWVEGSEPVEVGPVVFAADLSSVGGLSFEAEATRARRDDLGVFRSDYVQPFGTFTGTLPGGLELAGGRGVMERHSALW